MQRCIQVYKEHYDAKNTKRRLQWTYSLGQCNVKGTFGKKSFDLQVTTLQAVVMLAFNKDAACPGGANGDAVSFVSLQEALNMPEDILKRVLHSLACGKYKILKRIAAGAGTGKSSAAGGAASADKVSAFAAEGEDKGAEKAEKGQKGVLVTDIYAFNDKFE